MTLKPDSLAPPGLIHENQVHGIDPRDGTALEPVPVTPLGDIPDLVGRAREAAAVHGARSIEERASMLVAFKNALLARGDAFAAMLSSETGKPTAEAWLNEILPTADLGDFWSTDGAEALASHEPMLDAMAYPGKRALIERVPRGVIGVITPWNFPVAIPLRALFPALIAGNAVLVKASEYTPRCGRLIEEAAREVFGRDLVRVLQGSGHVGAVMIGSGIDAVIFTGSVATGRKVAHAAAEALIPVSLELGGNDAAIVLEDVNIERAARGILWGGMVNAGQNCASVERVIAVKSIKAKFEERLAQLAKELIPGRDFGPLTNERQLAIVEEHVNAALAAGARALAGGARLPRDGLWFAPTVLVDVPHDSAVIVDETFGPVIPVLEAADERAAIELANRSRYGLTGSVWTKDVVRGERVARELRAGVVMVNNHGFSGGVPSLPWTGVGESGYGVTNSVHCLDMMTRPRALIVDRRTAKQEMWWHPYTEGLIAVGRNMTTLRSGAGIFRKVGAGFRLLGGFAKRFRAEAPQHALPKLVPEKPATKEPADTSPDEPSE